MSAAVDHVLVVLVDEEHERRVALDVAQAALRTAEGIRSTVALRRALAQVERELNPSTRAPVKPRQAPGARQAQVLATIGLDDVTEFELARRMSGCGWPMAKVLSALVADGRVQAVAVPTGFASKWRVVR